jgi:DNA modification methylase
MELNKIYKGNSVDILMTLPDNSIDMCITSPPYYGLRNYESGSAEIGREDSHIDYIKSLVDVFSEVRRVLKDSGSCWVNIGDTYNGKGLMQIPSRLEIALTDSGWILRNEIIWNKPNPQPAPIKDRFVVSHEKMFFMTKTKEYYFKQPRIPQKEISIRRAFSNNNMDERKDNKRGDKSGFALSSVNQDKTYEKLRKEILDGKVPTTPMRTVWDVATKSLRGQQHFAVYPEELIIQPIEACCPDEGIVLDPFMGSGTTGVVAKILGKHFIGTELNGEYIESAYNRINTAFSDPKYCEKIKNALKVDDSVAKKVVEDLQKKHGMI